MPAAIIASSFALIGFAVAVAAGIAADNSAATTIWRALGAMILCYMIGRVIGAIAMRAMREHVTQYKQSHPIESANDAGGDPADADASAAPPRTQNTAASAVS
jgi:hypothetical protein